MSRRGRPPIHDILTPREWEVLDLLRQGLSNREIAERLGVTYDGARFHVSEIIGKLGVSNRHEAAAWQQQAERRWHRAVIAAGLKKLVLEGPIKVIPGLPLAAVGGAVLLLLAGLLLMEVRQQSFSSALGKIAYVEDGDIWVKALPHGTARRLTQDGINSGPQWSPSGEWLSFHKEEIPGGGGLRSWVMREDGRDARFVDRTLIAWSPNEDVVAFMAWDSVASRDDRGELVVENPDGTSRRRIAPPVDRQAVFTTGLSTFRTSFLSWSPDGQWIAFTEQVRVIPRNLDGYCNFSEYVVINRVRADGRGSPDEIYRGDLDMELATWDGWSADSRYYLFAARPSTATGNGTWTSTMGGSAANQNVRAAAPNAVPSVPEPWSPLFIAPVDGSQPGRSAAHLHWNDVSAIARSPDGRSMALAEGSSRASWQDKRIALFDAGTGSVTSLTGPDVAAISPAWSPDASQIAYTAAPDAPGVQDLPSAAGALAERRIWVMKRDGSNQGQLTHDPRYRDENPQWSADGKQILFARIDLQAETPSLSLWLIHIESGQLERIVDGLEVIDGGEGFLWLNERQLDYWRRP
jgi:Tol biopolymer transport system component/DNA-binding CsgD family transcriptional regulator